MADSSTRWRNRAVALCGAAGLALAMTPSIPAEADTVTMWGNAYAFLFAGNDALLEGARIRVVEYPDVQTTAGPDGRYELEVPDNATITPYVEFPGYYTTYLQTFHTSGKDLRQVNFQVPELSIYKALAGIVGADVDPETGLLKKCAIVSTFFQKEGRSFNDFDDFHAYHPHGVVGSTATMKPSSGQQYYFNKDVIPDPAQKSSSRDGGVLWANVDSGVYRIRGKNPNTRHSQFVASCAPGRLVNANPPWGLYELSGNEQPDPAVLPDLSVDGRVAATKVTRTDSGKRKLAVRVKTREKLTAELRVKQGGRVMRQERTIVPGVVTTYQRLGRRFDPGAIRVRVTLTDQVGNRSVSRSKLRVP